MIVFNPPAGAIGWLFWRIIPLRVGTDTVCPAKQVTIEPINLPLHQFHDVLWFGADAMPLARENHQLGWHVEVAQGSKEFLSLRQGHSLIALSVDHQCGGLDAARVTYRRVLPIQVEVLEEIAAEIAAVTIKTVADSFHADEIGNTRQGRRGLETVGVAHNPVGHETAVAHSEYAQPVPVDPRKFCQRGVYSQHDVLIRLAAPFFVDATLKGFTIAGRSARIGHQHSPTMAGEGGQLMVPLKAPHAVRSSVNHEDHRVRSSFFPALGLGKESLHIPSIDAFVCEGLQFGKSYLVKKGPVQMSELAFGLCLEVDGKEIARMAFICRHTNQRCRRL